MHLADQTVLTVRENMQDFEKELAGKRFVRTHAAYIVALRYCRKFEKNDIVLEGDVKSSGEPRAQTDEKSNL